MANPANQPVWWHRYLELGYFSTTCDQNGPNRPRLVSSFNSSINYSDFGPSKYHCTIRKCTRWERLWNDPNEQDSTRPNIANRLICETSRAVAGKPDRESQKRSGIISRPGRLHISQILKVLVASSPPLRRLLCRLFLILLAGGGDQSEKNFDCQKFKQLGVPITFKQVFTGVRKISNKFSWE